MVCFSHSSLYAPNNLYLILIVAFNKLILLIITTHNMYVCKYVCKYIVDIYLLCLVR